MLKTAARGLATFGWVDTGGRAMTHNRPRRQNVWPSACPAIVALAPLQVACAALALPLLLSACQPEVDTSPPRPRPVRTITVERSAAGVPVTLTGRIEAEEDRKSVV